MTFSFDAAGAVALSEFYGVIEPISFSPFPSQLQRSQRPNSGKIGQKRLLRVFTLCSILAYINLAKCNGWPAGKNTVQY
jgi:hypothetical protein